MLKGMEEPEIPFETIEKEVHHAVERSREAWLSQVALGSVLFAVLAAIASLMSNYHANEAMIDQIKSSDLWSYYQAKGIKSGLLSTKMEILDSLGKQRSTEDQTKFEEYKKEQSDISAQAKEKEEDSASHLRKHVVLSRGVTIFQISIAIAAIAALTGRKRFWLVGLGFALVGTAFLVQGLWIVS